MNWPEIIARHFRDWIENPGPSISALIIGLVVGLFISRMRHQGKIDALEERLRHKQDQIEIKEQAIQKLSQDMGELKEISSSEAPRVKPSDAAGDNKARSFWAINEQYAKGAESKIRDAISTTRYKFVFNPQADLSKFITFLQDGTIGEGRNNNESRWRVRAGQLEIINSRHEVYSRFNLLEDGRSFHHTNEPGLPSIKGQYMIPVAVSPG